MSSLSSFLVDRNSKNRIIERRLGLAQIRDRNHIFLIFKVKEIFQTKSSLEVKSGVMSNLPIGLFVGIYFG